MRMRHVKSAFCWKCLMKWSWRRPFISSFIKVTNALTTRRQWHKILKSFAVFLLFIYYSKQICAFSLKYYLLYDHAVTHRPHEKMRESFQTIFKSVSVPLLFCFVASGISFKAHIFASVITMCSNMASVKNCPYITIDQCHIYVDIWPELENLNPLLLPFPFYCPCFFPRLHTILKDCSSQQQYLTT